MEETWDSDTLRRLWQICLFDEDMRRATPYLIKVDDLAIEPTTGVAFGIEKHIDLWKQQRQKTIRRMCLSHYRAGSVDTYREELKLQIKSLTECLGCAIDGVRMAEHKKEESRRYLERGGWENLTKEQIDEEMRIIEEKMPKFVKVARDEYKEPDEDTKRWLEYIMAPPTRRPRLRGQIEPEVERWEELCRALSGVCNFERAARDRSDLRRLRRDAEIALAKREFRLHLLRQAEVEYEDEIHAAQDREGRPPVYSIEDTERWYNELIDMEMYHGWGGKTKLIDELIARHLKETGKDPSVKQMRRHLRKIEKGRGLGT